MIIKVLSHCNFKGCEWYGHLVGHTVNADWEFHKGLLTGRILVNGKLVFRSDYKRMPDTTHVTITF